MNHTITIATRQAPVDTLEPPTMGTLYRWECSCGKTQLTWRSTPSAAAFAAGAHRSNAYHGHPGDDPASCDEHLRDTHGVIAEYGIAVEVHDALHLAEGR